MQRTDADAASLIKVDWKRLDVTLRYA